MLEVPGMTEAALRSMTPAAVATLRWGLYARALAPSATVDIDGALEALADEAKPPSPTTQQMRRAKRREDLAQAAITKAAIRELLLLDDDAEDVA